MREISEMLLRRKNKINLSKCNRYNEPDERSKSMVVSIMKNIESLGFTFDREIIENLLTYSKEEIESFYIDLIAKLKSLVGADKEYNPMYPNFPRQIVEADFAELFVNAIIHYSTFGNLLPKYTKDERMPLYDDAKLIKLMVGTKEDVCEIFTNLVSSKTSLSQQDKDDIENVIVTFSDYYKYLPNEIPLKENVAFISKLILDKTAVKNANVIKKYYKTATDVLRLITAMSDGDISLATDTKFKSPRRFERRIILDLLSNCNNLLEDMYRYQYEWIRIGELIHPFEYKLKKEYKKAIDAFDAIRNKKKPLFNPGKAQKAILSGDMSMAALILKERPGELARQLDKLIRDGDDKEYIIKCFNEVVDKISVPVLLQVRQHFFDRNKESKIRVFFPKGNFAKAVSIPNELKPIDQKTCNTIVRICNEAIIERFRSKDSLGNVFIDDDMKNFVVPFSQRSAGSSNKCLVRGSRIGFNDTANAVRAFIWWTNTEHSRVDIDLSASVYDEDWKYIEHISYTNLQSQKLKAYHSGDITNGGLIDGLGVAEFIDIDVNETIKHGRYVVFQVYSFTGNKFSDLPNCRFGWMEREDVNSGEIFEPKTVDVNMDINSESTVAIPVIFDCKERKFIWCDMNLFLDEKFENPNFCNNVESNLSGVTAVCYAMTNLSKPDMYSLIGLNVLARGKVVASRDEADIIFSNDITPPTEVLEIRNKITGEIEKVKCIKDKVKIITAYDTDYVTSQLL